VRLNIPGNALWNIVGLVWHSGFVLKVTPSADRWRLDGDMVDLQLMPSVFQLVSSWYTDIDGSVVCLM
jgi:hypothetical protein